MVIMIMIIHGKWEADVVSYYLNNIVHADHRSVMYYFFYFEAMHIN